MIHHPIFDDTEHSPENPLHYGYARLFRIGLLQHYASNIDDDQLF